MVAAAVRVIGPRLRHGLVFVAVDFGALPARMFVQEFAGVNFRWFPGGVRGGHVLTPAALALFQSGPYAQLFFAPRLPQRTP